MKPLTTCMLLFLFLSGCSFEEIEPYEPPGPPTVNACDTITSTFTAIIEPLFSVNCASSGCHDDVPSVSPSLVGYDNIKAVIENGKYDVRVKQDKDMPPIEPLADSLIAKIDCWVQKGKINN